MEASSIFTTVEARFRETMIKWFGTCDYYCVTYALYCIGGVWTLQEKYLENSKRRTIMYNFMRLLVLSLYIWVLIGLTLDGYLVRNNLEKFTYSLSTSVFFIFLSYRTIILIPKKNELADCFNIIHNNFNLDNVGRSKSDIEILQNGEEKLKKLTKIIYVLVFLSIVSRAVCQLLPVPRSTMIPYPFTYPIETPYFEILFTAQTLGLIHFVVVEVAYELVVCGFLIRVASHFEIITKNASQIQNIYVKEEVDTGLKNVTNLWVSENRSDIIKFQLVIWEETKYSKWRNDKTHRLLRELIIHHQQILLVMKRMNDMNKSSSFIQLLGSVLLIILLSADVIWQTKKLSSKLIAQSLYAISTLLDVAVQCYYGTKIETKSHEAANSLYDTPWFRMSVQNRRTTRLLLMALWKHPSLKAGRVLPLNLETFLKLLDHIYSSITFMQNAATRSE